jgi:hypothetical protein
MICSMTLKLMNGANLRITEWIREIKAAGESLINKRIMPIKLSTEEAKAIRTAWIRSILKEDAGYFATNSYGIKLGLVYGDDVGGEFKKKIRKKQREEKRKLSVEEVIMIYEDFERCLKI